MPDTLIPPSPPVSPSTPPASAPPATPAPKLAGKYDTPDALEKGIREIRTKTGFEPLPDSLKLIGEGGLYADAAAAEREYKRMESLLGGPKPAAKPAELSITPNQVAEPEGDLDIPAMVTKAGLKMEDLESQFTEKGDLTEEQYAAIRKARPGLTKGDIKAIAEGMAAKAALRTQAMEKVVGEAQSLAGGEQQLAMLRTWAAQNIAPERLAKFNAQVKADPTFYPEMVRIIAAEHSAAVGAGKAQPLIAGVAGNAMTTPPSPAEYKELEKRALAGDKAAQARILAMPSVRLI